MTDLKKLAEFAAEFIGVVHDDLDASIQGFFYSDIDAPIFAHLAKREMEKLDLNWHINVYINPDNGSIEYHVQIYSVIENYKREVNVRAIHENEYIALWSAIREAVKDE